MPTPATQILPFDEKAASQDEYAAVNQHINRMRLERLPDDPPIPLEETIQNLQSIPPFVYFKIWSAWNPDRSEILAMGNVTIMRTGDNPHLAQFEITVLPEHRRQGWGRQLLGLIAEVVQQENRRLLLTDTIDRAPGGEAFMKRIGAHKGLEAHTNQLRLTELDHDRVAAWLARGQQNLGEFELGFWDGAYPEDQLQEVADLYDLTNQQPLGDLEVEDMHMTPEQLRQIEKNIFARNSQRWTFYVIERATGKFAGYTEAMWNPNRPEVLAQGMTGVFPQYRNRSLGRWLKAAMLAKLLDERPQVKYIRTANADTNAAMLKINMELGFKPYMADALWQVEIEKVLDYLQSKPK